MDIVFVVMPFADVGRPAIGVSLLKADALERGFSATILYENLRLADRMGVDLYQQVSSAFAPTSSSASGSLQTMCSATIRRRRTTKPTSCSNTPIRRC
jgi:hypothetical protein